MKKLTKILLSIMAVLFVAGYFMSSKVFFPLKYEDSIVKYSKEYKVDPYLMAAIIHNESTFREITYYEEGRKNGIIQLKDSVANKWAKEMGLDDFKNKDILKTDTSIKMEAWYLSKSSNKKEAIKSWVVRNVTSDDLLDDKEIEIRADLINGRITKYKILHPFLGK